MAVLFFVNRGGQVPASATVVHADGLFRDAVDIAEFAYMALPVVGVYTVDTSEGVETYLVSCRGVYRVEGGQVTVSRQDYECLGSGVFLLSVPGSLPGVPLAPRQPLTTGA